MRLLGPTEDERIKLPAKYIARAQMFDVLFGPSDAEFEDDNFRSQDALAPVRAQLRSISEDLRVCLDEAKDGLTSLETFTKNFDRLVAAGWAIAP